MNRQITAEETGILFQEIGRGIWNLQYLENALNTLVTLRVNVRVPGRISKEEALVALAIHRRGTLGMSLNAIKKSRVLLLELEARLTAFTEERNWFVHNSMHSQSEMLYTDDGRAKTIQRVLQFSDEAMALLRLIADETVKFTKSHGVETDKATRRAVEQLAELKGER